ncbi:MAG: PIN domain-containing protein [Myxococcales bacterium]|nr:PIN domain-containing protein [Myxococcales bacterium]
MKVFVDTSALYAILDRDDANHPSAKGALEDLLDADAVLMTSNYVLVETFALVQRRLGVEALRVFAESLLPSLDVHWVSIAEHGGALSSVLTANRRELSFVDCVSFQLMRDLALRTAFAFDDHFAEQGFELCPSGA